VAVDTAPIHMPDQHRNLTCGIIKFRLSDSPGTWLIPPVESTIKSGQVSGTSDASRRSPGLSGLNHPNFFVARISMR
jgi:hypothetical protein